MTIISSSYHFESAHYLPKVPESHKCRNLHGHNYKVEVVVDGKLDDRGFVMDFGELDELMNPLIKQLDHKVLNDIGGLENPTAEIIAQWLFDRIKICKSVRVYETERFWAEVSR